MKKTSDNVPDNRNSNASSNANATKSICVFCGSRPGNETQYMNLADQTGRKIAESGYRLVYGGGGSGLMGETARAAFNAGGDIIGIIPEFLTEIEAVLKDVPHEIVPDMHVRKRKMYDASDAFIVLPGGIGTMEEAVEVMSWMRMRLHAKPIVFLSTNKYWDPLVELMLHTIEAGFSPDWMRSEILRAESITHALDIIRKHWERTPPDPNITINIDEV